MSIGQQTQDLIEELSDLFEGIPDHELEASDFVNNSERILELREQAKSIVELNERILELREQAKSIVELKWT